MPPTKLPFTYIVKGRYWRFRRGQTKGNPVDDDGVRPLMPITTAQQETVARLEATIERLRTALERIARGEVDWGHKPAQEMQDIAAKSLNPQEHDR